MRDADCGVIELDTEDYVALTDCHEALTELLDAICVAQSDGRVVYLTGPRIGLAKDAVFWAAGERERNGYWAPRRCRA